MYFYSNLVLKPNLALKNVFPLVFFLVFSFVLNAQKETAIWYFGHNAGLDFNSGAPVALTDGALDTEEGCATISDPNGNILFYTDGTHVWNRNHQVMPNGNGLMGDFSSTQSAIIVPRPGSSTLFYIFTVDDVGGADGLMYSEVDMNLNGGLGDVTAVKNVQLRSRVAEKLTAVEHANGRDIWVLAHERWSDTYMAYLVTDMGVSATPVNTNIGVDLSQAYLRDQALGYLKASPDGSKIGSCNYYNTVEVFDFNSATGVLSNLRIAADDPDGDYYGLEFSPDSRMLYITDIYGSLYQYDTESADLRSSEVLIYQQIGDFTGGLQLALDGKIYMTHRNETHLSVIEAPNNPGLACSFVKFAVDLNGRLSHYGLPPFIQSFFLVSFEVNQFCSGSPTDFKLNFTEPILSVTWDFGDGNTSTEESPSHIYVNSGSYTVNATVTSASGTRIESEVITIYETPTANPAADYEVCSLAANYEFDLSTKDAEVLGAQPATDFTVAYYPSFADAQGGTNPLPTMYVNTDPVETIFARISNNGNTACYDITSFDLVVKQAPVLHPVTDRTVCDTDTDGLFDFDLSTKDNEVLDGQDPADFSVSYHTTQADADNA
ncbi:PKD domain-containing protein, partial [Ulvibacterium marinum]